MQAVPNSFELFAFPFAHIPPIVVTGCGREWRRESDKGILRDGTTMGGMWANGKAKSSKEFGTACMSAIDRPSMSTPWIHASAGEGSTGRQSTSQHRRREMSGVDMDGLSIGVSLTPVTVLDAWRRCRGLMDDVEAHASAGEGSTGRQSTSQHRRREMSVPLVSFLSAYLWLTCNPSPQ
jgi:hypothetical protein